MQSNRGGIDAVGDTFAAHGTIEATEVRVAPVIGGTFSGTVNRDDTPTASGSLAISDVDASDNPVAFSFYATKNLTTAEGGMLTGTAELIDRARPWPAV